MNPGRPWRLLFVCTGNICRSPMAEALARADANRRGWALEARSASVLGLDGRPAEPLVIKVMDELNLDLRGHRSQPLSAELVGWADYVLCMEYAHSSAIRTRFPEAADRTLLLGSFGGRWEIADPLGGWRWRFRQCRDDIQACVERFLDQLPHRGA